MSINTFDDYITPSAVNKAKDKFEGMPSQEFFAAAKAHDSDAINLLFYEGRDVIASAFFKYFLGPDKKFWRARIRDGDDREFAAEVYAMLLGSGLKTNPIDTFDFTKFSNTSLSFAINKFKYYLVRYCQALAFIMLKDRRAAGMSGNIPKDDNYQFISKDIGAAEGKGSAEGSLADFGVTDSEYNQIEFSLEVKQFLDYIRTRHPDLHDVASLGAQGNSPKEIAQKLEVSPYTVQKKQIALKDIYMKNFAEKFEGRGNIMNEKADKNTDAGNYKPLISYDKDIKKKSKLFGVELDDVVLLDPEAYHTYDPKGERYAVVVDIKADDTIEVEDETGSKFLVLDPKKVAKIKIKESKKLDETLDATGERVKIISGPFKGERGKLTGKTYSNGKVQIQLAVYGFGKVTKAFSPDQFVAHDDFAELDESKREISPENASKFAKGMKNKGEDLETTMKALMTKFHGGNDPKVIDAVYKVFGQEREKNSFGNELVKKDKTLSYLTKASGREIKEAVNTDPESFLKNPSDLNACMQDIKSGGDGEKFLKDPHDKGAFMRAMQARKKESLEEAWRNSIPKKGEKLYILRKNSYDIWVVVQKSGDGNYSELYTLPNKVDFSDFDLQDIASEYQGSVGVNSVKFGDKDSAKEFIAEVKKALKTKKDIQGTDVKIEESTIFPDDYDEVDLDAEMDPMAGMDDYEARKADMENDEDEDDEEPDYNIGDTVRINPAYSENPNGDTGVITGFSPSGSFVIIDVEGQGEGSYHLSDIEGELLEEALNEMESRNRVIDYSDPEEEKYRDDLTNAWYDEMSAFIADPSNSTEERLAALKEFDEAQGITDGEYNEEALDFFEDSYKDIQMELGTSDEIDNFSVEIQDWMDYEDKDL